MCTVNHRPPVGLCLDSNDEDRGAIQSIWQIWILMSETAQFVRWQFHPYLLPRTPNAACGVACWMYWVLHHVKFQLDRSKTWQVAQLIDRETTLQCMSVVAQISMLFYVFTEHCCRLLLQLVSPVNRQRLKCHRMQRCRANGWFSSRTKFVFKGMSPTNYLCTDR